MPLPTESFASVTLLRNYIQSKIVENNERGIMEEHVNNILNSVVNFLDNIGDPEVLTTDVKDNVVAAVNEVNNEVSGLQADNITLTIYKISNFGTL